MINRGKCKTIVPYKRLLCSLIALIMTLSVIAIPTEVEAQQLPTVTLNYQRLPADELPEGNIVYMGTDAVTLDEENLQYTFPIFREGDLSEEARIELHTIDMTALYSSDYAMVTDTAKEYPGEKSVLEVYMDSVKAYDEYAKNNPVAEESEEEWVVPSASSSEDYKSPLAQQKEEATGEPTRELYSTEGEDIVQSVLDSITPDVVRSMDYSSATIVSFAPGEDVRWVTFRIIDDGKSEGTETFSIAIADTIGAEVYEVTSTSVSITDDEPTVQSKISFTDTAYSSKGGKVTLKVKRTDAVYSLVDMRIYTCEDTARAGVNYHALDTTLAFMPYETEKEIELSVAGEGDFSVKLDGFTACDGGSLTTAKVSISAVDGAPEELPSSKGTESFSITLDGTQYTVEYVKGEATGKIMKDADPPIEVGVYYFSSPANFTYDEGNRTGSKPWGCGVLDCYYVEKDDQHDSYGDIAYYHTTTGKKGTISAVGKTALPGVYYQYIAADWQSTSNFGGGQKFKLSANGLDLDVYAEGKFDRNNSSAITLLGSQYNKDFTVSAYAIDDTGWLTPKSYLRFYGVAAMYKKYNISVSDPEDKYYLTGNVVNGVPETAKFTPAQVTVKCGAQPEFGSGFSRDIYANPDSSTTNLVFTLKDSMVNGTTGKFGVLKGYNITVGNGKEAATVSYPTGFFEYLDEKRGTTDKCVKYSDDEIAAVKKRVTSNLDTIPYDAYFIDWIDSVQPAVTSYGDSSAGYYQKLKFTPIVDYEEVKVTVLKPRGELDASFTNSSISQVKTYTFHAGDVLDLRVTCNEPEYSADGYEYSCNNGTIFDGPIRSTSYLQLLSGKSMGYTIRPALAYDCNRIELQFVNGAESYLSVLGVNNQGLVEQSLIESNSMYRGTNILMLNAEKTALEDKMRPVVGEVYNIFIGSKQLDEKYIYRPVITDKMTGKEYRTNLFNYVARNNADDNVLLIGYEKVPVSEMVKFCVKGTLVTNYEPIVSDGLGARRLPVAMYTVSLPGGYVIKDKIDDAESSAEASGGGEDNTAPPAIMVVDTATGLTDDNGVFNIKINDEANSYVYGRVGDRVTMTVFFGSDIQVFDVVLGGEVNDGRAELELGEFSIVYPEDAPKFSYIKYYYDKEVNNNNTDSNNNSIKIFDDAIYFEVGLNNIINSKLHYVSKVEFNVYNAKGELTATHEVDNPDPSLESGIFNLKVENMNKKFENGERLRVRVIEKVFTTDSNGSAISYELEYPEVETGFVFYVENLEVLPKEFSIEESTAVDIPILGAASASASTGLLSFTKTEWGNDSIGRATGFTLAINSDILCYNTTSLGTKDKLDKYDALRAAAKQADTNLKEVENYGKDINNTGLAAITAAREQNDPNVEGLIKDVERQKDIYYAARDKMREDAKQPLAGFTKAKTARVDIIVVIAYDFVLNVNDDGTTEYVFCSGSVALAATMNYCQSIYSVIYGVPVFVNFTGTLQMDMIVFYNTDTGENMMSNDEFDEYTGNLNFRLSNEYAVFGLNASIMAQAGVGMCNVISARGYVKYGIKYSLPTLKGEEFDKRYGVMLTAGGGIGFDLLLININFDIGNFRYGFGIYENSTGVSFFGDTVEVSASKPTLKAASKEEVSTINKSEYSAGTADLSGFGYNGLIGATPEEVSRNVLLSDAAERTRPKLVILEDGSRMVFFIGNRGAEGNANDMTLYYSVYSGGVWSAPQTVADDGTADTSPCVLHKDGKVYVAWADANRKYTESDSIIDKLNGLGISVAIYENGVMSEEYSLVNDQFFNFAPQLNVVEDKLYCSYMKRDLTNVKKDEDLLDLTGVYSTMAYAVLDTATGNTEDEEFISIEHSTLTDPLVLDYNSVAANINGVDYILATYTVDEDCNLKTAEDRELFLSVTDVGISLTFAPIKLTNDGHGQSTPQLTDIDGTVYLSWIENGSVFNIIDVSDMLNSLFNPESPSAAVHLQSAVKGDSDWYRKTSEQLGMDSEIYERTVYEELYNGNVDAEQINLQKSEDTATSISDYKLVTNGDDVYIFYTAVAGDDENDIGVELFGARYQRDDEITDVDSSEDSGLGRPVQITDYGKLIDEFDLVMTENSDIYMVSNHLSQSLDDDGNVIYGKNELIEIKFSPRGSLEFDGKIALPENMVAGNTENLGFTVVNNGLLTTTGYDYTVSLVKDGEKTLIESGTRDVALATAESDTVELSFKIPESTENTVVEVTVSEKDVALPNPVTAREALPWESRMIFEDTELVWDGERCYASTTIRNVGNKDMGSLTVNLSHVTDSEADKTYFAEKLTGLASGESVKLLLPFSPAIEDFNRLGYMDVRVSAEDENGNTVAVRNALFTPCAPVTAEVNGGKEEVAVQIGTNTAISAKVGPWSSVAGNVVYTVEDPTVAYVDADGTLHGISTGTTVIKANYPTVGLFDTITVKVTDEKVEPEAHKLVITANEGGTVSANNEEPKVGETVTLTAVADEGYSVLSVEVKDADDKQITVTDNGNGTYSFVQPDSNVTVNVIFAKTNDTTPPTGDDMRVLIWLITVALAVFCWIPPVASKRRTRM